MPDHEQLARRCEAATEPCNALDVLCEVALFRPDGEAVSCRANAAGTKVIYTMRDGSSSTFWARDWTMRPKETAAALRAQEDGHG